MLIKSTKNASDGRLKLLIYGRSGVGKTRLASTIGEPTLVISAEAGHLVLRDFDLDMIDMATDDNNEMLAKEKRFDRLLEIYSYIQTEAPRKKYKWIYIDSLTEIAENLLEKLDVNPKFNNPKMMLLKWAEYTKQMNLLTKAFRDIPYYNVVFTAISDESDDKDGNPRPIKPLLKGQKVPDQIGMYFDELLYFGSKTEKEEEKRYLLTQGTQMIFAKDRSGKLNKYEQPNLATIAEKIRGNKEGVKNVSK